ncbi:MAG: hypothetical protein WCL38_04030, partial [Actinomycetota bacterium]
MLDYFVKGNTVGVKLEQYPPSPVPLGTRDMKFRIVSPVSGNLVLLDLTTPGLTPSLLVPKLRTSLKTRPRIVAFGPHVQGEL